MANIQLIRASDGTGNASVATVQAVRAPLATTILVDTVVGMPPVFYASMGTPHTFTDPVTSETITVISEATSVDFQGRVDGGNIEIDAIAPGATDLGSQVGDIIIIKPTTPWANEIADVVEVEHNDDGTHSDITATSVTATGTITANNFVQSGTDLNGWTPGLPAPDTVTYNGNRSYDLVFNGTDLTDTVSEGMRLRTTRTVSAPTTAFSLDGTNDYYNKTSPTGLSFTTTFTCMAWVYLTSYPTVAGGIIARRNADTEGWSFEIQSDGTVRIQGLRIASNSKFIASRQSIPLNKWVHVAGTIDMTAGDTTAQKIWIDGVEVPRAYTLSGTATALVQGTTALTVGSRKSDGTNELPGRIDQAAVFSSQLSDATIKSLISQGLTGSESTLVSAFSNGSTTDLNTTNANNLTAQNGATTIASSPFGNYLGGTLDYGIITKTAFSTNTTLTVQVPEGCTIPTSGGVSAVAYSTQAVPYGFVRDEGRWRLSSLLKTTSATTSNATYGAYLAGGFALTVPVGGFRIGYTINMYNATTTAVYFQLSSTALTGGASTAGDSRLAARVQASAAATQINTATTSISEYLSSTATYVFYTLGATASAGLNGAETNCEIFAIPSYL
jgi:hypothetical protein